MRRRRRLRRLALLLAALALAGGVTLFAWANRPIPPLPDGARADRVVVVEAERQLLLLDGDTVLRRYPISLGGAPVGHKRQEGDQRTPEGLYQLDARNAHSAFHLSLHVSYPDAEEGRAPAR